MYTLAGAASIRPRPRYNQNRDASVVVERRTFCALIVAPGRLSLNSSTGFDRIIGRFAGCALAR